MKKDYIKFYKQIANYNPTKILHIGGHIGQEGEIYKDVCLFTFVEPVKEFANTIRKKGYNVINKAVGNERGLKEFYVNGQISSLLKTKKGHKAVVSLVEVVKLSDIQDGYDILIVDTEGSVLDVLMSGDLSEFKVIILEARDETAFIGEATKDEIINYLSEFTLIGNYEKDFIFVRNDIFKNN